MMLMVLLYVVGMLETSFKTFEKNGRIINQKKSQDYTEYTIV